MSKNEMSNVEVIEISNLATVNGGAGDGYTWGDFTRGLGGAGLGALGGGPIGAAVGFGSGFMSRKIGQLGDAVDDLSRERARGQQLEQQRQQMLQRQAQPKK